MLQLVGPRIPYVVLANKSDLPGALSTDEIAHRMDLPSDVAVVPTVATENKGVRDALPVLAAMIIGGREDARCEDRATPGGPRRAAPPAGGPRRAERSP